MTGEATRGFWARQFHVPQLVRDATKAEFGSGSKKATGVAYREEVREYPEQSEAQRVFDHALVSMLLLNFCGPFALYQAVPYRRAALAELKAIAERRRPPELRRKVVYAYWITQGVIWFLWFFLGIYVLIGLLVGLGFATGLLH